MMSYERDLVLTQVLWTMAAQFLFDYLDLVKDLLWL